MDVLVEERFIQQELQRFKKRIQWQDERFPHDVRKALLFINEHLFKDWLDVNAVKQYCKLRNNNISCRFHFYVGSGMRRYIEDNRLLAAMHLLQYPELRIYMIALSVGYTYPESFTRAFRRRLGGSPNVFRQCILKPRLQDFPVLITPLAEAMQTIGEQVSGRSS